MARPSRAEKALLSLALFGAGISTGDLAVWGVRVLLHQQPWGGTLPELVLFDVGLLMTVSVTLAFILMTVRARGRARRGTSGEGRPGG